MLPNPGATLAFPDAPPGVTYSAHPIREQVELDSEPLYVRSSAQGEAPVAFHRVDAGYLIRFAGVGDFLVEDDGREVACWPVADPDVCQAIYEQQIWPLAMAQQGGRVYHGGAVAVDGRAVVLLGPSGQGKSTLVAAFARRGYAFLCDDTLVVNADGDSGLVALPHVPCLRMWHDSAAQLVGDASGIHFHPGSAKPRVAASSYLPHWPLAARVGHMFLLGDSLVEAPMVTPLSPADGVIGWAANAFVLDLKDRSRLSANLRWAAAMAASTPALRLDYPRRYEDLDGVVDAILTEVRGAAA